MPVAATYGAGAAAPTSARRRAGAPAACRRSRTGSARSARRRAARPRPPSPSRSSSAWVNPGGISSTWWLTRTVAGESGSSPARSSVDTRSSRPPRSSPAAGSSSSSSSGSVISARAIWTRLRSPSLRVPNVRSREVGDAELLEQLGGAAVVEVVVLLAPAADDAVRRRDDHVADRLAARDPLGERGAGQADPRAQLEHVDRAEHLLEDRRPRRWWGAAGRRRPGAAWSCRRRWARGSPSARPPRPSSRCRRAASP